jgi:Ribbon-helix-helix protein, copG family
MRKTTVYLSDEEAEALRSASIATGKSQSELIREGVRQVTAAPPKRVFHSMGIGGSKSTSYEGLALEWDADELYDWVMGRRGDDASG